MRSFVKKTRAEASEVARVRNGKGEFAPDWGGSSEGERRNIKGSFNDRPMSAYARKKKGTRKRRYKVGEKKSKDRFGLPMN